MLEKIKNFFSETDLDEDAEVEPVVEPRFLIEVGFKATSQFDATEIHYATAQEVKLFIKTLKEANDRLAAGETNTLFWFTAAYNSATVGFCMSEFSSVMIKNQR